MPLGDWLVSDPEQFKHECKQLEHRTTIAYFGLDFIITKKGELRCIEINGQNSGTKGFTEAYGEDFARKRTIEYLASFGLPVSIYSYDQEDVDQWAAEKLGVKLGSIEKIRMECSKKALNKLDFSNLDLTAQYDIIIREVNELINSYKDEHLGAMEGSAACSAKNDKELMSDEEYFRRYDSLSSAQKFRLNNFFFPLFEDRLGLRKDVDLPEKSIGGLYNLNQAEGVIWVNSGHDLDFDQGRFLVVNPNLVERATRNKWVSEILMSPWSQISLPCKPYNFESGNKLLADYLNKIKTQKVVLKPTDRSCGDGVVVLDKNKLLNKYGRLQGWIESLFFDPEDYFDDEKTIAAMDVLKTSSDILVQPFFESKPFYCTKTGKHHNGAIRYIAMAHSDKGKISVHHIGGYVRLAPEPIGDSISSCVANLSKGAHAAPLSRKDQNCLEKWVDAVLPVFYRRALRLELCKGKLVQVVLLPESYEVNGKFEPVLPWKCY